MSNNNQNTKIEEKALSMYKETVSPRREHLITILNQIPEKEIVQESSRVTRSPYMWVTFTQLIALSCLVFLVYPTYTENKQTPADSFYEIDNEISTFEAAIDAEDLQIEEADAQLL